MIALGDVVPAVLGADRDAVPAAVPEHRVARLDMRGDEVVLPALPPPLPRLSAGLERRLRWSGLPVPDPVTDVTAKGEVVVVERPMRVPLTPATDRERAEAQEPIERLRRLLGTRAHPRHIEDWIRRWAVGVANAPAPEQRKAKVEAILLGVGDLPVLAFTTSSVALALQRWKWWPAAAEVRALLEEVVAPYRTMLAGLEAVCAAPRPQAPAREAAPGAGLVAEKDPAVVAAVREAAAAYAAEVAAREAAVRARRLGSFPTRPVSSLVLATSYEASIARGGSTEVVRPLQVRLRSLYDAAMREAGDPELVPVLQGRRDALVAAMAAEDEARRVALSAARARQ